ncbi:aldose epimerase family protein [Sinomicrobium weinanense]|uniref:Aldose 1-epimerase n=1 Tax=Sinomicrobium weinanense TaxID=2842200 RepID=A0A926JSK2_9FLAO|nr:aldose epimerase family protein [Sinomicrobium weinanense]MBC9796594.1 galactose mutarotase [Sinomicrobium weinanense]MBU3123578.1 galactose mutarotase [Sinomicrobium weinanense]
MKHSIKNAHIGLNTFNYGATIQQLLIKDKNGNDVNVVLGFDKEEDYYDNPFYLGASIGRYAGRISQGGFSLNGDHFALHQENGVHLHGGKNGLNKKHWQLESMEQDTDTPFITYSVTSPHLEEGYPGNLKVSVTYRLVGNRLEIAYEATTDKATVLNLTNHAYFNLEGKDSVLNHELKLSSKTFVELDKKLLPTGDFLFVKDSAYDFLNPEIIGNKPGFSGIDDVFVLNGEGLAAILYSPETGIEMKVATNQRAMVIYTPEDLGERNFVNGANYGNFSSICFEAQTFPDAPNQPNFPSAVLQPGEVYSNKTILEFGIR